MSGRPSVVRAPLSSFVGRRAELNLATELMERGRLITVTGPGGAGKTRLAIELAGPTALAFADLSPALDADSAQAALAGSLGIDQPPGGASREMILRHLRERSGLVVVDNCEQVIDAAAELVQSILLEAPDIKILATSQQPLGLPGEAVVRLGSLAAGDAEQLFLARVSAGDRHLETEPAAARTIAEICRRLDSIPLAIELAAARARTLPLEDLLAALEDRFAVLVGSSRAAPTRQQTLEAAVAWSYELLTGDEKLVFDRIAVLPGSFTTSSAVAVAGEAVGARRIPLLLSRLGERSLLELSEHGFRMVETLREFGRQRLRESGQLGSVLADAARHYDSAGSYRHGLTLSQAALAELPGDDPRRPDLLDLAAAQAERLGQYAVCAEVLNQIRQLPAVTRHLERLANIEMRLASALSMATGDVAQARGPAEHAVELYATLGDTPMQLQAEIEVAWLEGLTGNLLNQRRLALDVLARATAVAPRSDAHLHALGCAAVPLAFAGEVTVARLLLEQGMEIAESRADTYQLGWFAGILANTLALAEGPLGARRLLESVRPRVIEHLDPVFAEADAYCHLLAGTPRPLLEQARSADDVVVGFGLRGGLVMSIRAAAAAEGGQAALAEQLLASAGRLFAGSDVYYQLRAHRWLQGVVRWCGGAPAQAARELLTAADGLLERQCDPLAAFALRDAADAAWDAADAELEAEALRRLRETAGPLEGILYPLLVDLGGPGVAESLGRIGCHALRARSLERESRLEEAAAAYEELGLRYRADRALARLAVRGAEPSPVARRLARLVLFDGVPASDLEPIVHATVRQTFAPGERLHAAGAVADAVFALDSGSVRVGASMAVAGDLIGERALLSGEVHVVDAVASDEVEALRLRPAAVLALVRTHPRLAERLVALVLQRTRAEARTTGSPEMPDVAARVLSLVQQATAAAGGPVPAYEILPVYLEKSGAWILAPNGRQSWLVEATPGRVPAAVVGAALDGARCHALIVHSTSWRFDAERLVLTYLAILPEPADVRGFEARPVRRADLARGSATSAPASIDVSQVVEHGLRHLSWLSRDDPVIREELSGEWLDLVADYQPEPFRAL